MKHKLIYVNKNNEQAEYGTVPYPINETIGMKGIVYYIETSFLDLETHNKLVKEVTSRLETDSYDHGSQWRETQTRLLARNERLERYTSVVSFRVRDSY